MFFFWFREIWKREEENRYIGLSAVGHRWVSAAHNAQRTLHDGGAGEYGKCTAVQYNGGEKYLGKAQVLSSPSPYCSR